MSRPVIVVLMLLVLIWTSTLLHDVAEAFDDYHSVAATSCSNSPHIASSSQATPSVGQAEAPEHFHFAGAISRHNNNSVQSESAPMPAYVSWGNNWDSVGCARYGRAPPHSYKTFQTRLYLVNRQLLI
ncbi:MAG: hypothetical protein K2X77_10745 [Candidatus Obscuribacterales bacterium]|nr:hypothetical protein [Candidatus Obscuribacterales bacterium]